MSYIEYLFLALIIIALILVTVLFIKLYLKIKSTDKDSINLIQFPKETENKIEHFINSTKTNHSNLVEEFKKTQVYEKNLTRDIDEKIKDIRKAIKYSWN